LQGGVQVAEYHANLISNAGTGNAHQLRALVDGLNRRVRTRFGLQLEEEMQFPCFEDGARSESPGRTKDGR
jgi:UDP-N-acetylmuramate dehydrogenase